ncbi:MAG: hypothetical protein PVG30_02300 [Gammaproteobacteria bacterium]|jgi:hypothetical protein
MGIEKMSFSVGGKGITGEEAKKSMKKIKEKCSFCSNELYLHEEAYFFELEYTNAFHINFCQECFITFFSSIYKQIKGLKIKTIIDLENEEESENETI